LAFDSGCARCQALSNSVYAACQGGLEILPLDHQDVRRWAGQARPGSRMPWVPTLFRVDAAAARMWTGPALAVRLALHLGPRTTIRVLRALGAHRTAHPESPAPEPAVHHTRRRFLELAAGGAVAAGILITGSVPARADPVADWLRTNRQRLPRRYPELALLPPAFRSAVYAELTPAERSAAWVTHLVGYRVPTLTTEQAAVLGAALVLAADPGNFGNRPAASGVAALAGRADAAFGVDGARAIFATLGPSGVVAPKVAVGPVAAVAVSCQCSTVSNYCGGRCQSGGCTPRSPGCGFLYQYSCNGHCV